MDTYSGRIYESEEYNRRTRGEMTDEHQAEFERAQAAGRIVPISDAVARQVRAGQRVEERRRKRKAAKAARKKNRAS